MEDGKLYGFGQRQVRFFTGPKCGLGFGKLSGGQSESRSSRLGFEINNRTRFGFVRLGLAKIQTRASSTELKSFLRIGPPVYRLPRRTR